MDRTCDEKRAWQHLLHSPSLDTRGEAETRATQEHLALNCGRGAQNSPSHMVEPVQKLAENRVEWGTFVAALLACRTGVALLRILGEHRRERSASRARGEEREKNNACTHTIVPAVPPLNVNGATQLFTSHDGILECFPKQHKPYVQ